MSSPSSAMNEDETLRSPGRARQSIAESQDSAVTGLKSEWTNLSKFYIKFCSI